MQGLRNSGSEASGNRTSQLLAARKLTLHERLRESTRPEHRLIDETLSRLNLACPAEYGVFLGIHRQAMQLLAPRWRSEDRADFDDLLGCLEADLRELGCPVSARPRAEGPRASLRSWGVGYVIRGSRLGAVILRQRVPPGAPAAYLSFVPRVSWPNFLRGLERNATAQGAGAEAQIIRGAKTAFSAFATAAATAGLS